MQRSCIKNTTAGVPVLAQWKRIRLGTIRFQVRSLASLSGLRIWCFCELWCRLQTRLSSLIAVAVAWTGSCSSHSTPSLGTSVCLGCSKKIKDKKKKTSPKRSLFFVCLLGVFWPQLQHMGVLTPRIESELQLGCKSNNAGSLTYDCAVPGMELTPQQ